MIKWQTSGIAKAGKYGPAMVYAKEIAKYAEGIVGNEVQVFARIGGQSGLVCWQMDCDDLAAYEDVLRKIVSDQRYNEILANGQELFIDGSFQDVILKRV